MRVFVAAELAGDLLDALVETQAALRATVRGRYVAPDALHVTLAFLGEIRAADVDVVSRAVSDAAYGTGPVDVTLGTLGTFGPPRKATLWQSVDGAGLVRLAESVREALAGAGLSYDTKRFLAHVTLMRAADLARGTLPAAVPADGRIEAVRIWRSRLGADGATYETLERIGLVPGDAYRMG